LSGQKGSDNFQNLPKWLKSEFAEDPEEIFDPYNWPKTNLLGHQKWPRFHYYPELTSTSFDYCMKQIV